MTTWFAVDYSCLFSTSFTQPVSQMISSQVTSVSSTSTEYFIELDFQYSIVSMKLSSCKLAVTHTGKREYRV